MKAQKAYYLGSPKIVAKFISQARTKGFGIEENSRDYTIRMNPTSGIYSGEIIDKRYLIVFTEDERMNSAYNESVSKLQKLAEEFKK